MARLRDILWGWGPADRSYKAGAVRGAFTWALDGILATITCTCNCKQNGTKCTVAKGWYIIEILENANAFTDWPCMPGKSRCTFIQLWGHKLNWEPFPWNFLPMPQWLQLCSITRTMGHVTDHPTMHHIGIPRHSRSLKAWFWLNHSGNSSPNCHCGKF